MSRDIRKNTVPLGLALMIWGEVAQAQWVLLARRAVGRIEQVSQSSPKGDTAFGTASVIIDVPVDRVFETVQRSAPQTPSRSPATTRRRGASNSPTASATRASRRSASATTSRN
jgi:hypothetical protein